tara:strand:- start:500 stop:622 length:123 start_codon:yes stop_codon:yes gene_type:complete
VEPVYEKKQMIVLVEAKPVDEVAPKKKKKALNSSNNPINN